MSAYRPTQELLDALTFELYFLDHGGYERSVREPRHELSVFRESPSCLNYASDVRTFPCSECWLMDFVPVEHRAESVPCHHIRLNNQGDTVDELLGQGRDFQLQQAPREWLVSAIARVKEELTAEKQSAGAAA